jgi:hypothetical protein
MHCFEVDERVKRGLRIARFPEPHIPVLGREPLLLDPKLTEFINAIPRELEGDLLIESAVVHFHGGAPRLAPEPPNWRDTKALVRVTTQTIGGALELSANSYIEDLRDGRVTRKRLPFPPIGVQIVHGGPEPIRNKNDSTLELLLILEEGASFRIFRTGELEGASPEIFVHWRGGNLETTVPRRFRTEETEETELHAKGA